MTKMMQVSEVNTAATCYANILYYFKRQLIQTHLKKVWRYTSHTSETGYSKVGMISLSIRLKQLTLSRVASSDADANNRRALYRSLEHPGFRHTLKPHHNTIHMIWKSILVSKPPHKCRTIVFSSRTEKGWHLSTLTRLCSMYDMFPNKTNYLF